MFDRSRMRYDAIGGVRGDDAPPPPPVPVLRSLDALPPIDVEARGPQCVAASGSAILWRANAHRRQTFTLAVLGGSATTVAFAVDAQEVPWPGRLLPEPTTTDVVVAEAGSGFRTTSFRFVTVPTTTGPAMLSALINAGCLQQAEAVAAYLDQSAAQ
ncbi:hypothetical protein ASG17_12815 [Brevundimonas sp. Leaf363]|nr:hypothetical protein ASG17_12815 [Brevundimonas sp. Leaf363]